MTRKKPLNLLAAIKRAADDEQLKLKPLPEHIAAPQPEYLRMHYALLLIAMLGTQQSVSESQARVICLLLDALYLGDIRGMLFEMSCELDEETLIEATRIIRDAGLARHLIVDAMVLLRLDAPLDDEMTELIGEFASFLDLDALTLSTCSLLALQILGLRNSRAELAVNKWPGSYRGLAKPLPPDLSASGSQPQEKAKTRKKNTAKSFKGIFGFTSGIR